jgi:hypothetical protein
MAEVLRRIARMASGPRALSAKAGPEVTTGQGPIPIAPAKTLRAKSSVTVQDASFQAKRGTRGDAMAPS